MFLNRISNSKSDIIEQCLLKFYYRYYKRYEGDEPRNQKDLNFGTYIHKIFEDGYQLDTKGLVELSLKLKEQYNISDNLDKETEKCINNFVKDFNTKIEGETVGVELHDVIPLDKEHDINFEFVIDRVIKGKDGGFLVVDYKTGKKEKSKFDLYRDNQLKGYTYAVSEIFKVPVSKITAALFYPRTGNLVPIKFQTTDILQWKAKEIKKVWSIRKKNKEAMTVPSANVFCDYCQYKSLCPLHTSKPDIEHRILLEEAKLSNKKSTDDKE